MRAATGQDVVVGGMSTPTAPRAAGRAAHGSAHRADAAAGPRGRHRVADRARGRWSPRSTTTHFIDANSIQQLLSGAALIALLGVGETLVIVTRNVDLSVGSVLGLSAYIVGDLFKYHHIPVWSGFAIGILVGVVAGAVNGFIVTVLRVPSLVVTLGMLYVIRGIDGVIVNGDRIDPESIPSRFTAVGYKNFFGIPWLAIIVAVVVVVAGYAMRSFRASRDLYAIGSNPDAAALAGIPIERRVFTAFVISGALAGLAGALFLALHTQIDNSGGHGLRAQRRRGRRRRRRGDLRRQRHRRRRRARRAAAEHDQPGPRRLAHLGVLEPGDRRRAAAGRDRLRPLADPARDQDAASRPRERTVTSDVATAVPERNADDR